MAPSFDSKFDFLTALTLSKDGAAFVWIAAYLGGDRLLSQGWSDAQCPFCVVIVQILWSVFCLLNQLYKSNSTVLKRLFIVQFLSVMTKKSQGALTNYDDKILLICNGIPLLLLGDICILLTFPLSSDTY